jgi:hypothetical protein
MGLSTVTFKVVPKAGPLPRREHVLRAFQRALHELDVRQDMIGAWSGLVSDLLKHPETAEHPIIWEGTKKITDGAVCTIEGLRALIERTCKAEGEGR